MISLFGLNENFEIVGQLVPTNLQWNRKYYECGDFEMELPISQYDPSITYIYSKDRPELGVVNKQNLKYTSNRKQFLISGYFAENLLNNKCIYPQYIANGQEPNLVVENMVNKYKDDLPIQVVATLESNEPIDIQYEGDLLGDKAFEILQPYEKSYRVMFDFLTNKFTFKVWQGLDRTQDQTVNNFVVFADIWENLKDIDYELDNSNQKNYAIVRGSNIEENIDVIVDLSNGASKRSVFIDSMMTLDTETQTLDQFKASLKQYGIEQLTSEYTKETNIVFTPLTNGLNYMVDYDLGDKCDTIINELGVQLQFRIVAVYEVFKNNQHTIELEVGNQILKKGA